MLDNIFCGRNTHGCLNMPNAPLVGLPQVCHSVCARSLPASLTRGPCAPRLEHPCLNYCCPRGSVLRPVAAFWSLTLHNRLSQSQGMCTFWSLTPHNKISQSLGIGTYWSLTPHNLNIAVPGDGHKSRTPPLIHHKVCDIYHKFVIGITDLWWRYPPPPKG